MQWNQIKTLFILCFLILDIFLIKQFLDYQNSSALNVIDRSSREEQLEANVQRLDELPEEAKKDSYIYVRSKRFSEEDIEVLEDQDQVVEAIFNNNILLGEFEKPIPVNLESLNADSLESTAIVTENMLYGENYFYWGKDDVTNTLIFFQKTEEGNPTYFSQNAVILVFLNENNEMVQYVQTALEKVAEDENKKTLISAYEAVANIFNAGEPLVDAEITDTKVGYHTFTGLSDELYAFAPSWKITFNNDRYYIVNALTGYYLPRDNNTFIGDTIDNIQNTVTESKLQTEFLDQFMTDLSLVLKETGWSEEEGI